jgi:hypothetical protein
MTTIDHPSSPVWFVARNEDSTIVHYGRVCPQTRMDTSQPIVEQYATEIEMLARLAELGVTIENAGD